MTSITGVEISQQFRQVRVALKETPEQKGYYLLTSFGAINLRNRISTAIEEALASGPQELGTLQDLNNLQELELAQAIVLLLEANRISLDRGEASLQAQAMCQNVNRNLDTMQLTGRPYSYRAAASIGIAVNVSVPEAFIESALQRDPGADPLPALAAGPQQMNVVIEGDPTEVVQTYLARRPTLQRCRASLAGDRAAVRLSEEKVACPN